MEVIRFISLFMIFHILAVYLLKVNEVWMATLNKHAFQQNVYCTPVDRISGVRVCIYRDPLEADPPRGRPLPDHVTSDAFWEEADPGEQNDRHV